MAINHLGELYVGQQALPLDARTPVLEEAPRPTLALPGLQYLAPFVGCTIAAYIPINLIPITDGQIYLTRNLFSAGVRPAIDVGRSVSRIGGRAQHPRIQKEAGRTKLDYLQFLELELFTRFGARLEVIMEARPRRGQALREIRKQGRLSLLPIECQMAWLVAFNEGLFDKVDPEAIPALLERLVLHVRESARGPRGGAGGGGGPESPARGTQPAPGRARLQALTILYHATERAGVPPVTPRDSIFIIQGLPEQQTSLRPAEIMADTSGVRGVVFGLFWLLWLWYEFSPRLADIGGARFWRIDSAADYVALDDFARQGINTERIERHW